MDNSQLYQSQVPHRTLGHANYPAFILFLALMLSGKGCGGTITPSGYSCGNVTSNHCYGIVDLHNEPCGPTDNACLHGYRTSIYVTNQMGGGDGFVDNEMWLASRDYIGVCCWVEAGYMAVHGSCTGYFYASYAPGKLPLNQPLGCVPAADIGQYAVVQIQETSRNIYSVSIMNKATNYSATVNNPMWVYEDYGNVQIGQELAGSSGAYAGFVPFLYNAWIDGTGHWQFEKSDGAAKYDSPPYSGWLQLPSQTPNGGAFSTQCCSRDPSN